MLEGKAALVYKTSTQSFSSLLLSYLDADWPQTKIISARNARIEYGGIFILQFSNFLIPFGSLISLVDLSAPLSTQDPTLNLLSTCLMVCSILGSRPISFPNLFLLSSPSPTD